MSVKINGSDLICVAEKSDCYQFGAAQLLLSVVSSQSRYSPWLNPPFMSPLIGPADRQHLVDGSFSLMPDFFWNLYLGR
jgi:hypothetical protein